MIYYFWPILSSQDGTSEQFIGEWAEARGIRDRLFIATKVGSLLVSYSANPQSSTFFQ